MENKDFKASVYHAGNEFYIGVSPSNHAVSIDTNHERNAAPTPVMTPQPISDICGDGRSEAIGIA